MPFNCLGLTSVGGENVEELLHLCPVYRSKTANVKKTCMKYKMHVRAHPRRMFRTCQLPDQSPSEVCHSQPADASQHSLRVMHLHLNPVCLRFVPTKPLQRWPPHVELPLDLHDRPCVRAWPGSTRPFFFFFFSSFRSAITKCQRGQLQHNTSFCQMRGSMPLLCQFL